MTADWINPETGDRWAYPWPGFVYAPPPIGDNNREDNN